MSDSSPLLKAKVALTALDQDAARELAHELEHAGVRVTVAQASGVYLEALQLDLERIFRSVIELEPQAHFRQEPRFENLQFGHLIESVSVCVPDPPSGLAD